MNSPISPWTVETSAQFDKQVKKLDNQTAARVNNTLLQIAATGLPRSKGKQLTGNLSQYWCYRIGDYRVICNLQDTKMVILAVRTGHRREVYER